LGNERKKKERHAVLPTFSKGDHEPLGRLTYSSYREETEPFAGKEIGERKGGREKENGHPSGQEMKGYMYAPFPPTSGKEGPH